MSKYLWSLVWVALIVCGIKFFSISDRILSADIATWAYQLCIGALLLYAGFATAIIALDEPSPDPIFLRKEFYSWPGTVAMAFGVVIFLNFNRYDDVILHWRYGWWVQYVIGMFFTYLGVVLLIHVLTIFGAEHAKAEARKPRVPTDR